MTAPYSADAVLAAADLANRAGATNFEIGYLHDGVPIEKAAWWATVEYQGAKITAADHASPSLAALALAERLLAGAACRCGQPVTLQDGRPGCRWTLQGQRWEPGCDAAPLTGATRGDHESMRKAYRKRHGKEAPK